MEEKVVKNTEIEKLFEQFTPPTYEEWKEAAVKLLKGKPFEKAMFTKTPEDITIQPIYNLSDLEKLDHIDSLPGYPPYVRGTKVEGEMVEPWLCAQQVYEATPSKFNETLIHDLYCGQNALSFCVDQNTLSGYDPDSEKAEKIGYRGLSLATVKDVETAFADVVLNVLPFHVNVGENPMPMMSLLAAYAKKSQFDIKDLKGVVGYDPFGYLATHGEMKLSVKSMFDYMAETLKFIKENNMKFKSILVEGHPYHNGGLDSVNELAYILATLEEYITQMLDRGFDIEFISKRIAVSVSVGSNYFMEVSKLRAIKMLYSNLIKNFGGSEEAQKIYLHAKTSSWTKTVYDPYVNMLRNASEAFSAAVGFVDSMEIIPFDEPIREASEFSRRVSRNVQYFLLDEAHLNQPIDPAGGSWYVETLTSQIAKKSWAKFQEIHKDGKMFKFIETKAKDEVSAKYEEKFKDMAKRKYVFVGVNQYANMTEEKIVEDLSHLDDIAKKRIDFVSQYKKERNQEKADEKLAVLASQKTMNAAVNAFMAKATLGEVAAVFHNEAEATKVPAIVFERGASRYEALRDKTMEMKAQGKCPTVFSINMGPIPQHKGRADFSRGFFEVGAFEVIGNDGFIEVDDAVKAAVESKANVGIICSTDPTYPELVPEIAKKLKAQTQDMILMVAGRPPKDLEPVYREAGVDDFIYMGANCYDLLKKIQEVI